MLILLFFQFSTSQAAVPSETVASAVGLSPVAICKDIVINLDASGKAVVMAEDIDDGSYDADGTIVLFVDKEDFDCSNIGDNDVRLIVLDNDDNFSVCHANVTVVDPFVPTLDLVSLPDITAECIVTDADVMAPTASDNCAGTISGVSDVVFPVTIQGTTVITWTYDDGVGNVVTQTQNVIILDVTAPVPDNATLADVNAQCEVNWGDITAPTATDNCTGSITGTTDATFPITVQGTTVLTWTFDDGNGNISTQTQNVVIADTTPPVADLSNLPDIQAQCTVVATDVAEPTASDNCGGTITVTNDASFPINAQGTTVITWTYTDANGNASTQTQNVVIADITAPVADLSNLPDVLAQCTVAATDVAAPTATDNCGGTVAVANDASFPITTQGTTVITWTYTDENGNASTQTQNVILDDTTAPVPDAAALNDITVQCEVNETDLTTPTASDNCGGTVTVTNDASFPITTQGTTVITWTYTDENGNASTQTQNVIIEDTTGPTPDAEILADVTAQCMVASSDLTAPTATDNCVGTVAVSNDGAFPITTQGTTVITWTYEDINGNTTTQAQNIIIADTTAPAADASSLPDVTATCEVLETDMVAPTASDNCGSTVSVSNDATFPITAQGTTVVTWTFTDVSGNSSTQTQNVIISDTTPPVPDAASLPDVSALCEVVATDLTEPTASDNCSAALTITNDASFPISTLGTTVVTWTFTDAGGNTATQTQNVIVGESPVANVTLAGGSFTYDGIVHSLAVSGLPSGASVTYQNNDQINAGTYEVTATVDPGVSSCPQLQLKANLVIDKATQTISFDEIPVKNLESDSDFNLTATASSGLPVSYTYTYSSTEAPATVSSSGFVSLLTSGTVEITASQPGNENYLPADPVTRTLTIESSDATIHEITINGTSYPDPETEIRYQLECGDDMAQVDLSFTTETNATADTPKSFMITTASTGTFTKTIVVTSQDGSQSITYQVIIEKPYDYLAFDDIVIRKFNNVLLANNNPDTNGGYRFTGFKWYMNGTLIGTGQYYSAGENAGNTLNPNAVYYLELTDSNGKQYRTCDFTVAMTATAINITVSPNPAAAGRIIDVTTTYTSDMLTNMKITVSSLFGTPVMQLETTENNNRITLPASLAPGTYVVTTAAGGVVLSAKIVVN